MNQGKPQRTLLKQFQKDVGKWNHVWTLKNLLWNSSQTQRNGNRNCRWFIIDSLVQYFSWELKNFGCPIELRDELHKAESLKIKMLEEGKLGK